MLLLILIFKSFYFKTFYEVVLEKNEDNCNLAIVMYLILS